MPARVGAVVRLVLPVTPYFQDDAVTIYLGDCRDIMPQLGPVDLVLTDPPWGGNFNTDSTRFTGGDNLRVHRGHGRNDWGPIIGDDVPFNPEPFLDFPRVILWGANHFARNLPIGTWLIWLKKTEHLYGSFLSDAELAWMKGGYGVYACEKQFPPPSRIVEGLGAAAHPTQKPEILMQWCIEKAQCPAGGMILDPFMGSGTTLRAAKDLGRKAIGIEIEEKYCHIAAERMRQAPMNLDNGMVNSQHEMASKQGTLLGEGTENR